MSSQYWSWLNIDNIEQSIVLSDTKGKEFLGGAGVWFFLFLFDEYAKYYLLTITNKVVYTHIN